MTKQRILCNILFLVTLFHNSSLLWKWFLWIPEDHVFELLHVDPTKTVGTTTVATAA